MNYYFIQKKNVYSHNTLFKLQNKIFFVFSGTTVFYTMGKYLNCPQLFSINKTDVRGGSGSYEEITFLCPLRRNSFTHYCLTLYVEDLKA